jgi:hypothetical protein
LFSKFRVCFCVSKFPFKPMGDRVGVSGLADHLTDDFANICLHDGPSSDAETDGSADEAVDVSSTSDSLDSTYLLQSNAVPFYVYAAPSVISQSDPHAEAPARPVFGCVARSVSRRFRVHERGACPRRRYDEFATHQFYHGPTMPLNPRSLRIDFICLDVPVSLLNKLCAFAGRATLGTLSFLLLAAVKAALCLVHSANAVPMWMIVLVECCSEPRK